MKQEDRDAIIARAYADLGPNPSLGKLHAYNELVRNLHKEEWSEE